MHTPPMIDAPAAEPAKHGAASHLEKLSDIYQGRFSAAEQEQKRKLWDVLVSSFFQRYVRPDDDVLDLGAGYCEFINTIRCRKKFAVDLNVDTPRYAAAGVTVIPTKSSDLRALSDATVDVVFVSNFFEHLPNKDEFLATLRELHRVLRSNGRLLVLQPNIRLLNGAYWDFVDHHLPLTERTLVEAMGMTGLHVEELRTRFLPYTTKSRFPQSAILVRLYLALTPLQWLLGKQTWLVARKP